MLDQETRYAHSVVASFHTNTPLSTRGAEMLFTGIARRKALLLFPKISSIKTNGPTDRIIVINPLRCAKLVLSALSCVSDRVSPTVSNGRSISLSLCVFHKKRHTTPGPLDNYSFLGGETTSRRFVLRAADDLQDNLQLRKGKWSFYFCDERTRRVRRSPSRFLRLRRN